jgi:hypothetical protein
MMNDDDKDDEELSESTKCSDGNDSLTGGENNKKNIVQKTKGEYNDSWIAENLKIEL